MLLYRREVVVFRIESLPLSRARLRPRSKSAGIFASLSGLDTATGSCRVPWGPPLTDCGLDGVDWGSGLGAGLSGKVSGRDQRALCTISVCMPWDWMPNYISAL